MAAPRGRLIIVCGLPGTGKTTFASALARDGGVRFAPDDWMEALGIDLWDHESRDRVEALQWDIARQVLVSGGTAIIEWGTWGRAERGRLREEARALGAGVELVYLAAPPEVLFERVSARGRENPPITLEDIREWAAAFEVPGDEEWALYDRPGKGSTP